MTWLVVALGLFGLVFLHELGHFTVALAVGIRPRSFYVGFPPARNAATATSFAALYAHG